MALLSVGRGRVSPSKHKVIILLLSGRACGRCACGEREGGGEERR